MSFSFFSFVLIVVDANVSSFHPRPAQINKNLNPCHEISARLIRVKPQTQTLRTRIVSLGSLLWLALNGVAQSDPGPYLLSNLSLASPPLGRTAATDRPPWPDISTVAPDLEIPPLDQGKPSAGKRVKETLAGWPSDKVYHVLRLPNDWRPGRHHPVLVEYAGNGGYTNRFGDASTGRPEDSKLGYGMSAGRGFIWVCLPYLNEAGTALALQWWGDAPAHKAQPTLDYCHQAVAWICREYDGDTERVVLCGFSRGAIACNFLGLHDDETAKLWHAFVAFSHYDGVRLWPYPGADRESARARLRRLGDRPQFLCAEGDDIEETGRYLARHAPGGHFTVVPTGFRNHNDAWVLRPSEARSRLRQWLADVCCSAEGAPPTNP